MQPGGGRRTGHGYLWREEQAPDDGGDEEERESEEIEGLVTAEPRQVRRRGDARHRLRGGIGEIDQRRPRPEVRRPERELSRKAGADGGQANGQRSVAGRRRPDPARHRGPALWRERACHHLAVGEDGDVGVDLVAKLGGEAIVDGLTDHDGAIRAGNTRGGDPVELAVVGCEARRRGTLDGPFDEVLSGRVVAEAGPFPAARDGGGDRAAHDDEIGLGLQGGGDGAERTLVGLHRLSVRPGPGSVGEGRALRRAAGGQGGIDQRDLHAHRGRSRGKARSHRVLGTLRYAAGEKQKVRRERDQHDRREQIEAHPHRGLCYRASQAGSNFGREWYPYVKFASACYSPPGSSTSALTISRTIDAA